MISGKEAKLAWANGEAVQFKHDDYPSGWIDLKDDDEGFSISYFNEAEFRLKPRTITINSPKHVAQHLSGRKVEITFESHHDASVFFNEMQEVMFNDH